MEYTIEGAARQERAVSVSHEWFRDPPEWALNLGEVMGWQTCEWDDGEVTTEFRTRRVPDDGPDADPGELAVMARDRMQAPVPGARFAPPLHEPGSFLLVGLPTWIWVDEWEPLTMSVTAGSVTTTVTATPVELAWSWPSSVPSGGGSGSCGVGNVAYNTSIPHTAQSTPCSVTFQRPSAREPGEAYQGTITVHYDVTWTSNIGLGGDLGRISQSTPSAVRVGEQQVLNR